MANEIHSKLSVVKLDTSGGVLTNISTYCNKFSNGRMLDKSKVTCFGATDHAYLAGFGDGKVSLGGPWTRALDNHMSPIYAAMKAGTLATVTFEYGPEGSDSGDVKYTGELIMDEYTGPEAEVESPQEWTAEFTVSGGVTVTTY